MAILKDGTNAIVEIKGVTPSTQTRLNEIVEQLRIYADAYEETYGKEAKLVLVVPGALSAEHIQDLKQRGVDTVIDGPVIQEATRLRTVSDADFVKLAEGEQAAAEESSVGGSLLQNLGRVCPGIDEWSIYQKLAGDILEFLFCPPLGKPRAEYSTREGHNRRDYILRNHKPHEFWGYMRSAYEAHYRVVDAKNSARSVRKADILQIANYLSPHGPGLFAIIMSRKGIGSSGGITQREQWAFHKKMIIVVDDTDVRQMITMRTSGDDPSDLLAEKIENFRLGL